MLGRQLALSKHAQDMVDERKIPLGWIERVLELPTFEEPDVEHPGATRAYAPIMGFGNRMLRVVYYDTGSVVRVITLFFYRRATTRSRRP
jgi:hypothetical protein